MCDKPRKIFYSELLLEGRVVATKYLREAGLGYKFAKKWKGPCVVHMCGA